MWQTVNPIQGKMDTVFVLGYMYVVLFRKISIDLLRGPEWRKNVVPHAARYKGGAFLREPTLR
jgi:hypothetical protein